MAQFAARLKIDDAAKATNRGLRQILGTENRGAFPPSMVHSVAGPRHPPDTVLHPEASIVDAIGMSVNSANVDFSAKPL
jgi:hypothetical protein